MPAVGSLAIIPKARGMFAKRLRIAEYEELMRRRTVPELAAVLKRHPYFQDSLATLSTVNPHRSQLEDLLNMDMFQKYERLLRYDFTPHSFADYYLWECETREIISMLHMLSSGMPEMYLKRIPSYLVGKLSFDLYEVAESRSFEDLLEALKHTPYYKVLYECFVSDPDLHDFPAAETKMLCYYYQEVFDTIEKSFSGQEQAAVRGMFLQEAEMHNLDLIIRVKMFYPNIYTPEELEQLLLPFRLHVTKSRMQAMTKAPNIETLHAQIQGTSAAQYMSRLDTPGKIAMTGSLILYRYARRLLHLTTSPSAALAAFMSLARLERENVVNVIEGVRYGLPPERIRDMMRF